MDRITGIAARYFDALNRFFVYLASIILIFILLSVIAEIALRSGFNKTITWVVEVSEYSMLFITLLGAAAVLKADQHVKIDILFSQMSPKSQVIMNIVTSFFGAIVCAILFWYGGLATLESYQRHEAILSPLGPPKFVILLIVPIGSLLLTIQFLRIMYTFLKGARASTKESPVH